MKHTKGKQKIEMKRVEDYEASLASLSKRKVGILKKMNEIIRLCDVGASFLVFSQAGKPHTFSHPSMEVAVDRVKSSLRHEASVKDDTNIGSLVEAYKRQENEKLMKEEDDFAEELKMAEEMERKLIEFEKKWSNIPDEGFGVEEMKQIHQEFVELNNSLSGLAGRDQT